MLKRYNSYILCGDLNCLGWSNVYNVEHWPDGSPAKREIMTTIDPDLHYAGALQLAVDTVFSTQIFTQWRPKWSVGWVITWPMLWWTLISNHKSFWLWFFKIWYDIYWGTDKSKDVMSNSYFSLEYLATLLGVSYLTVIAVRAGTLVAYKVGRQYRVDPDDFAAFMQKTRRDLYRILQVRWPVYSQWHAWLLVYWITKIPDWSEFRH